MRHIYLETSAVLAFCLNEVRAPMVHSLLQADAQFHCSVLTLLESRRAITRHFALELINQKTMLMARRKLALLEALLRQIPIDGNIILLAGERYPIEPVRSLDAIHLASLMQMRTAWPDLELLSFDKRLLNNAKALGFQSAV